MVVANKDLRREAMLCKLERYEVVLDEIGYVQQGREEVLVRFLSECESLKITSKLLFRKGEKILQDLMSPAAAIDRLVHHSIIGGLDNKSYQAKQARNRHREAQ